MVIANTPTRIGNRSNRMHAGTLRTLRRQAATIKHDARNLAKTAGAVAREQLDPVRDYVHDKPVQALLIAGSVGLVLGFLFGRR